MTPHPNAPHANLDQQARFLLDLAQGKAIGAGFVPIGLARHVGARILGIVGRDGGYTAQVADACVVIPTVNPETITAHTEAFHAVIWHLVVSHPDVKRQQMKWESIK